MQRYLPRAQQFTVLGASDAALNIQTEVPALGLREGYVLTEGADNQKMRGVTYNCQLVARAAKKKKSADMRECDFRSSGWRRFV